MGSLKIKKMLLFIYKKIKSVTKSSFRTVFVQVPVAATETLSINHRVIYGPALQVVIYIKAWNTSHTVWIQILIMRFLWNDLLLLWMCHCPRSGMTPCWPPCDLYLTSARPQQVVEIKVRWSVLGLWSGNEKWVALVSTPRLGPGFTDDNWNFSLWIRTHQVPIYLQASCGHRLGICRQQGVKDRKYKMQSS